MTDVLDPPGARSPDAPQAPETSGAPTPVAPAPEAHTVPATTVPAAARWLLAGLLAGSGAIHVAMAPSHLAESAIEGAGFVAAAWLQLLLAAVVLVRPTRRALAAVVVTGAALVAVWGVSRVAGLPVGAHAGHAESVSLVDGACVALEVVAVLVAAAILAGRRWPAGASRWAVVGAVGALALATAAVASPSARDHAAGSHGEHASAGDHAATGEHAHAGGAMADGHADGAMADDGFAALSNGHQHEHGSDEPLTPEERTALATELAATAELVQRYPTVADAEAAGWMRSGPFSPGLGVHYRGPEFVMNSDGDMDPDDLAAPMLVFDGLEPDAPLAGFMYIAYGRETEPQGFAGPNDHWHYHESVCIVSRADGTIDTPFGADLEGVTEDMCTEVGGTFIPFTGYMVHVWNVPGYESPDGMFTELNPRITCPDGTYDRIDIEDLGSRDTVCRNA
jgi:hypothetical protein